MRTLLLSAALLTLAPSAGAGELALRDDVTVHGPVLRLADVLDSASQARLEGSRTAALGRVPLVTLGLDAAPFVLRASDVADRMSRAVAGGLGAWRIAAGQVKVRPQTTPLDAAQRGALLSTAESVWKAQCALAGGSDCRARARFAVEELPQVPAGAIDFVVRAPLRPLDVAGEIAMSAAVRVDGVTVGRVPVRLAWTAQREALQLRQSIAYGEALRSDDLRPLRVDAHSVELDAVAHDPRDGIVRATRALAAGAVVPAVAPAFTALYRRGDAVPVRIDIGHVNVVRKGVAVQDARAGSAAFVQLGEAPARVQMPAASNKERTQR